MERHCAPCKEEGKDVNATKQCHKCNVFLCEPCSENHKQEKSTEDHHVVDLEHFVKKSTSKNEPSTSQQKSSTFSEDELASDFLDTVTLTEDTVLYHGAQVAVESTSVTSKQEKLTASKQADPRRLKATACLEFSVKRSEDKKGVDVTGVLCLSDNIVVVDYGNDVLKLFDQDGIYLSSTPLKNDTWAITYVGDTLFATCGLINTIYLWTLHGKTIVCEDALHPVNPRAHGIHYNGTYFCLQHNWNNTITILDRQGRQVRKIIMKKACGKKFSFGFDIHMDTNNIYVPCSNEHGVLCMTIEGQALWFTSLLWTPCGITEIQGTLCVAAYYNHCLHLITKEGEYAKKLLDKADLRERPSYIFCGEDNILTIALDDFVCVLKYSKIVEEDFSDQYGLREESLSLTEEYAVNVLERFSRTYKCASFGVYKQANDPQHLVVIGYDTTMMSENKTIELKEKGIEVIIKHPFNINDEASRISNFTRENTVSDEKSDLELIRDCIRSNASELWSKHSNLRIITGDFVKSRRGEHIVKPCVVLYCLSKGFIPLHEDVFPSQLYCAMGSLETDVREGYFVAGPSTLRGDAHSYNDPICMGSSIGSCMRDVSGSLGLFVDLPNQEKGFLTCCHVLFDCIYPRLFQYELVSGDVEHKVIQPGNSAFCSRSDKICGTIQRAVFRPNNQNASTVSVDAALVKVTSRLPSTGHFVIQSIFQAKESGYSEKDLPVFQSGAVRRVLTQDDRYKPLLKSGTSSGLTKSCFKLDGVQVRIKEDGVALGINDGPPIIMQGQYEVNSDSKYTPFFIPGDSGSAVFIRETTGSLTCVGIALGKTSYGTAIVTPIGAVLDELHLQDSDVTKFP